MHTNILNKVLAALTGLLLCTESAVAQVQGENGYWKFRDATVFGVTDGTEEGTGSNTLIDAVKGKGVKTTKVVKEAVKNLTQNTTSDAMGKVIDPDSIGGQYVKHMVDDGRGELVNLVFE